MPRAIVTVHHDPRDTRGGWLSFDRFLPRYREARLVHCLNSTQAALLAEQGLDHTCIIPHGVDRRVLPVPASPREWSGNSLRLGLISRRYSSGSKGEELFAALLPYLDPRRIAFTMVGMGRRREATVARAHGFEAKAWEHLPYHQIADIYASLDALLILSPFEGGPACLPEALGSGVPVLCTPVGMCVDFVKDGRNGLLLTGQPKADAEQIMALTDDHGRTMATLNSEAFVTAPAIPSWEHVMAQWHHLYASALSGRVVGQGRG